MKTLFRILLAAGVAVAISACYPWMKRIEVQQGNIVEQQQLDKLKPGISREQVRFLLGTPLVTDHLSNDQWFYYFYLRDEEDQRKNFRLTINFADNAYTYHTIDGEYFDIEQRQEF